MDGDANREGPRRARPRSFVGGGNIEFTYDKHHGGIRDFDEPKENGERKKKRPHSLYDMFSKDMVMLRENSTSSTKPDGTRSLAQRNNQEKAQEINKDKNKISKQISSDRGEEGLGKRTMSDSTSRDMAKALYVELSSTPKVTSPKDDKFNAVSKLRSLFDQNNAQTIHPRTFSDSGKRYQQHQSLSFVNQTKPKNDNENPQADEPKRKVSHEKTDLERRKKLFGPPAPIKLDDVLKRPSPRSPDDVTSLPRSRRQISLVREPYEKREIKLHLKQASRSISKKPEDHVNDDFEKIHNKRRLMQKKRSSSFEFEGLEDNVQVFGAKPIDINAMLGLGVPKEDPVAEEESSKRVEVCREETQGKVVEPVKEETEEVENTSDKAIEGSEEIGKGKNDVDLLASNTETVNVLPLEPVSRSTDAGFDEKSLDWNVIIEHRDAATEDMVEEEVINESKMKDVLEEQPSLLDIDSNVEVLYFNTEKEMLRKEEKFQNVEEKSVDEDCIIPEVEKCAESGIDFDSLGNLEDVNESHDSILSEADSFDSFALHVKNNENEIKDNDFIPAAALMGSSVDESIAAATHEREKVLGDSSDYQDAGLNDEKEILTHTDVNRNIEVSKDHSFKVEEDFIQIIHEKVDHTEPNIENSVSMPSMEELPKVANVDEDVEQVETHPSYKESKDVFNTEKVEETNEAEGFEEIEKAENVEEAKKAENIEETNEAEDIEDANETESIEETYENIKGISGYYGNVPMPQLSSMIDAIAGLDKDDHYDNEYVNEDHDNEEDHDDEEDSDYTEAQNDYEVHDDTEEGDLSNTVTLDDDEYDSDNEASDKSDLKDILQDSEFKGDQIDLPPTPAHSCLYRKNGDKKKDLKVSFHNERNNVIFTYSADEYNRSNSEIDSLTASAEWELEKRVEDMDIFSVNLDKRDGGLGLSIIGLGVGTESGVEKLGIFVKSLTPNGAAAKDRRIQVEDQILEVNGISLVGVTQVFAANTLRGTSGKVRFLMGRDKGKKRYQAPTSTADPLFLELERKHNVELSEMKSRLQKGETRIAILEHNLDEAKEKLKKEKEGADFLKEELESAKNEVMHMKEKNDRKSNEKIGSLERSISELTNKLGFSEENLDKIQHENDEKISELEKMLEEAEKNLLETRNENNHHVSMLEQSSKKLSQVEEHLAAANQNQEHSLTELQELRIKCSKLELEIESLNEAKLELEQVKMSKEVEKVLAQEEHNLMAEKDEDDSELQRLRSEVQHLSDEVTLRTQFADIIVAERDSLKTLVTNLEIAQENQLEAQEKKEIETAVRMMAYENRIVELENEIKELEETQKGPGAKKKKLFPDIGKEKEVKESVDGMVKDALVESQKTMPFMLPPRDYDAEDSPIDIAGKKEVFQHAVQEGVAVEDQKSSISRKSSTSSSSESDEEKPKETAVTDEVSVVKSDVKVEEVSPGLNEDFEKENLEDIAPVVNAADVNEVVISGSINIDEPAGLENTVNPIEKPPRSYSDVSDIRMEKQLRSNTNQTVTLQPSVMEANDKDIEEKVQGEGKIEEAPEVGREVETKVTNEYQIMIERGFKGEIESKTFDEEILKDLPESSVDSDSELLEAQNAKLGEGRQDISIQGDKTTFEDANADGVKTEVDEENVVNTVNQDSENPSLDDGDVNLLRTDIPADTLGKGDDTSLTSSEKDRSSFMEAFSKDPSFGSWFSGETTVLEQDKGDEEAEEIASKVVEGKDRALSSSSSSSSSPSSINGSNDKSDLNTSIKLDESYLERSHIQTEIDETDSPLNRMESLAIESPLSEQAKMDDFDAVKESERPRSTNFDDLPITEVLPNTAQHDKRKLAGAIQRKSQRPTYKKVHTEPADEAPSATTLSIEDVPKVENSAEDKTEDRVEEARGATASTEHVAVNIDYAKKDSDKEKRRSIFGFLSKLGGKKKHRKSTENLLAIDERNETRAKVSEDVPTRDNVDEEDGVVPLEMQRDVEVRISSDSGVETHPNLNGVSSEASDSISSSRVVSPDLSNGVDESDGSSSPIPKANDELSWIQRPVIEWDVRQVGLWLIQLELGQYSQTFQERNIDGSELLNLNGARLKDLGVQNYDHRALIKKNIREFKARSENRVDPRKDGKNKEKFSKRVFWKGKYTVND